MRWLASWVAAAGGRGPRRPVVGRLEDEDHVDVGDVVELVAAALAHGDHGQPGASAALSRTRCRATASAASRVPAARSEQLGRRVVDAEVVGEVAGGEPQQQPAVLHPQRVERRRVRRRSPSARRRRVGADRAQQVGPHGVRRGAGASRAAGRSARASARGAGQVVGRAPRWRRARRAAASRCPRRRRAPRAAPRGRRPAVDQAAQRRQRQVGVGRAGDQRQQRLGRVAEGAEQAAAPARRPRNPEPQPAARWLVPAAAHAGRRPRRGRAVASSANRRPAAARRRSSSARAASTARSRRPASMPRASCEPRSVGPRPQHAARRPRGAAAPPTRSGANRTACTSPRRCRGQHVAPSGSAVTMSSFHWTPRRGRGQRAEQLVAGGPRLQPTSIRPSCWPGVPADLAAERDGDQLVAQADAEGRHPSAAASRTRCLTGPSHGARSSSWAPIAPPSTSSASYAVEVGQRVAGVWAADVERAAGLGQPVAEQRGRALAHARRRARSGRHPATYPAPGGGGPSRAGTGRRTAAGRRPRRSDPGTRG